MIRTSRIEWEGRKGPVSEDRGSGQTKALWLRAWVTSSAMTITNDIKCIFFEFGIIQREKRAESEQGPDRAREGTHSDLGLGKI